MKISIDTKEDSVSDIKRLITMLQNFVNHKTNNPYSNNTHTNNINSNYNNNEFVDMFAPKVETNILTTQTNQNKDDLSLFSMFNEQKKEEIKLEEPKKPARVEIVEY